MANFWAWQLLMGSDIFITLDKNLKNQQNLNKVDLKFIVLLAPDNKHQTLQLFIDKVKLLLKNRKDLPKVSIVSTDKPRATNIGG